MSKYKDLQDMTFGRLTVLQKLSSNKHGKLQWLCCRCPASWSIEKSLTTLVKKHAKL